MSKSNDSNIVDQFLAGEVFLEDTDNLLLDTDTEYVDTQDAADTADAPETGDTADAPETGDTTDAPETASPDAGDSEEGSVAYIIAKKWQEEGKILPGIEIKTDIDEVGLEELYEQSIASNALKMYKTEIAERLKQNNIDPDKILGEDDLADHRKLQQEYEEMAKLTYDELVSKSSDVNAALRSLGMEYHYSRNANLTVEEVNVLVDKDITSTDEEELLERYTEQFGKHANTLKENIRNAEKTRQMKSAAKAESDAAQIQKLLESGKIGNRKYSKEEIARIKEGIFTKNQVYDGPQGRKRVSLYELKRLQAEDSIERQLELAASYILGENVEEIKEKHKRVGGVTMLEKLAAATSGKTGKKAASSKNDINDFFVHDDN